MRTIRYRGWNPKNEKWIYGYYLQNRGGHFVCEDEFATDGKLWEDYEVVPESVGQFTGICESGSYQDGVSDENQLGGKMIYEGDIVVTDVDRDNPLVVVFYECMFGLATIEQYEGLEFDTHPFFNDYAHLPVLGDYPMQGELTVIGNVFNNPLLDVTTKSETRRIIIIGEEKMMDNTAEYHDLYGDDTPSPAYLRNSLKLAADRGSKNYIPVGDWFAVNVSSNDSGMCHCFRAIHYGKYAAVFRYLGVRKC